MTNPATAARLIGGVLVLLAAPMVSAQLPTVALCAAEQNDTVPAFTDTQTRLMNTGRFARVDIVNTILSTPSVAQLLPYDALLVWTNARPSSYIAWGNVLAQYVDLGGGVVVAVYANCTDSISSTLGGRWQNGYEVIMDQSGTVHGAGGVLETILVPAHPVMAGVTSFAGGTIGVRPAGTALEVGATLLATWGGGKVLAAVGANPRRVDLGFWPNSTHTVGWASGGDLLMANALESVAKGGMFQPYGTGCPGSLGVPTLSSSISTRPVLGATFSATLGNLPLNAGIIVAGFSNTTFGAFTLPLGLTPFGLPGCNLLAEPVANLFLTGAGNSATWSLGIPNNLLLFGTSLYSQGFSLDPPANAVGLTVSNGGRVKVGL